MSDTRKQFEAVPTAHESSALSHPSSAPSGVRGIDGRLPPAVGGCVKVAPSPQASIFTKHTEVFFKC